MTFSAQDFRGSIPALITPMSSDGAVDFAALARFVDWQITEGSTGLVPVGTTGESATLTKDEHIEVVKATVDAADGRVPVMAGTGSNATHEAIVLAQKAEEAGADAFLIATPYYNKPSQAGMFAHYKAIHDNTGLPIFLYNIPGRSVVDMTSDTMSQLFELDRIVGVKDATGDLARAAEQRLHVGADFIQLSGEDATAVGFNAMGGQGCISVSANVAPRLCADLQKASLTGDLSAARALQDKLLPLHKLMFTEPSPAPAKYVASLLGLTTAAVRLPILPMSEQGQAMAAAVVAKLGLQPVV